MESSKLRIQQNWATEMYGTKVGNDTVRELAF